ncbi:tetratricopeptide repeat protein, partial [bacterium]|nr:tetratricopeptide repeat protein [bacterium]
ASYHIRLGWNYVNLGRNEEAIREVKKAVELNPNINTYEIYWVTQIYIKAGEYDKAIDRIKMHLAEPNWDVTRWSLKLDPLYDPLRGDPRFQKLVE